MKNKKKNWNLMDPIEVWKIVQKGDELKVFPNSYLDKDICKILIRHLLLKELKMTRHEILNIDNTLLSNYNLGGLRKFFDYKLYKMLIFSFPELEIQEWEVKKTSPGIWKDINIRNKFVRYIAKNENINLSKIEDLQKFSAKLIQTKYKGSKALLHAGGLFELIKPVISDDIKEWQVFKVSKWNEEKAVQAIKWLIEEKLNWNHEQIYNNLSVSIFYEYNLGGLLSKFCNHSPLKAINLAYPDEFDSLRNKHKKN